MVVYALVFFVPVQLILVSHVISVGCYVIVHDSSFAHVELVLNGLKCLFELL